MAVKVFNYGGQQYLGVQTKWNEGEYRKEMTEIHKVDSDGMITKVAKKIHTYLNDDPDQCISKYRTIQDGGDFKLISRYSPSRQDKNLLAEFDFRSEFGGRLMSGAITKEGKLCGGDFNINPKVFENPEMLSNNAKRIFKMVMNYLTKTV